MSGENKAAKGGVGYTIIEVMIVLAVSGIMFLIAASFINGKQERSSFTEGVNEMASRIQDTIEQVTDGQYSDVNLNCQFSGSALSVSLGANAQGTNSDCVFIGKLLHLSEAGVASNYETFSVAGLRGATDFSSAYPLAVHDLTTQETTPQQLTVSKVTVLDASTGGSVSSFAFGFLQGLGSLDSITGTLMNGPQSTSLYYVLNVDNNKAEAAAEGLVNSSNLKPAAGVDICVTDGSQYADINIGNADTNNNQLTVDVKRDSTTAC